MIVSVRFTTGALLMVALATAGCGPHTEPAPAPPVTQPAATKPGATKAAATIQLSLKVGQFQDGVQVDIWVVNASAKAVALNNVYTPCWGVYTWFDFELDGKPARATSIGSYSLRGVRQTRTIDPGQKLLWGSVLVCSSQRQIRGHDAYTPYIAAPAGSHRLAVSARPRSWRRSGIEEAISATAKIVVNPYYPAMHPND